MKLIKNRKIAVVIAIIVIIGATFFGVSRSLNRLARDVEALFYEGVYLESQGFTQPPVSRHLGTLEQVVLSAVPVFSSYDELSAATEALSVARRSLLSAQSLSEKYEAFQKMRLAGDSFFYRAQTANLTEDDSLFLSSFRDTFNGAVVAVRNSEYNVRARNYMGDASIIARLLSPIVFVTPPQAFDT